MAEYINLETLITATLTSLFASFISVNIALRKYKSEKWWDFKASCHLSVIEALNNIIIYCDLWLDEKIDEKSVCDNKLQKYKEEFKCAGLLLKKQASSGKLLLSQDIYEALFSLTHIITVSEYMECNAQVIASIRCEADDCLNKIIPYVKRDLKVNNSFIDK
jgi:hypothetical protein